jgi:hypothetical protein
MRYATTQGDESMTALAARIFGVGPRTQVARRAAKALRKANPALAEVASLPKGTPIAVPPVEGGKPAVRLRDLSDFAARGAFRATRAEAEPLGELVAAIADAREASADAHLKRLRSAAIKRAAKDDPATAERVKRAIARAEGEQAAAKALRAAQRRATPKLAQDIARLL